MAKLHAAQTALPVVYPVSASRSSQIHCEISEPTPAQELFIAVAMAMQAMLGTLPVHIIEVSLELKHIACWEIRAEREDVHVTQPLNGFALGNAPEAQRKSIA